MKNRIFLAALILSVSACAYSANGEAAKEKISIIELESFYGLVLNSPANVILEKGDKPAMRIEADPKDLGLLTGKIENGSLVINGLNKKPVTIYLTIDELNLIEVNGNGKIYSSQSINSDLLLLKVIGNGSIRLDVRSLSLGLIVKGSGKIYASGSTGSSFTRIYGDGKVITTDLDSFNSTVEVNDGKQAFRSGIRQREAYQVPLNQNN